MTGRWEAWAGWDAGGYPAGYWQTSDYFVHKNLGTFLREQLAFYIKDQVIHVADLEGDFEGMISYDTHFDLIPDLHRLAF